MKSSAEKHHKKRLLKWVDRFSGVPLLVVGDLMLDRAVKGSVDRISPEAPVPVVNVQEETFTAGGAGNVVNNLVALNAIPLLVAVRGDDTAGEDLVRHFHRQRLSTEGLLVDPGIPTSTKIRILAGQQQIVRVDYEKKDQLSRSTRQQLSSAIRHQIARCRGVVISDYGKGVVSRPVIQQVLRETKKRKLGVTVDPKTEHFMRYKGVDCITPNAKEAIEGMRQLPPKTEEGYRALGKKILRMLRCECLLMTRGEKGILLFSKKGPLKSIPTQAKEVFDVTGAGDTVVATFSLARAVGASHADAAELANVAAGLVVAKKGTAVVSRHELKGALR